MSTGNAISPVRSRGFFASTTRRYTSGLSTGTSTSVGGVYQLDLYRNTSRVSGASDPLGESLNTINIPNSTGTATGTTGIFAVATEVVGSGAVGLFIGGVGLETLYVPQILVNAASTNIGIGDLLVPVSGQVALVKQAAGNSNTAIGQALGTATTDGALIPALFWSRVTRIGG